MRHGVVIVLKGLELEYRGLDIMQTKTYFHTLCLCDVQYRLFTITKVSIKCMWLLLIENAVKYFRIAQFPWTVDTLYDGSSQRWHLYGAM